jgi:hypothetical protein
MSPAIDEYMHRFWANGFPPQHAGLGSEGEWLGRQAVEIFGDRPEVALLAYPWPRACALATALGLALLARSRSGRLVALPVVVTLAAAIARQYPFAQRLLFFLLPCVFLALGAVAEWAGAAAARSWDGLRFSPAVLLGAMGATPVLTARPVYHLEDVRPVLDAIAARGAGGTKVYVYYGMGPALWFYRRTLPGSLEIVDGGCHRGDSRAYLPELDRLRGASRAFVLLGHTLGGVGEREDILRYLNAIGAVRARFASAERLYSSRPTPTGAAVEAFELDLSDPRKLRAVSAATFALSSGAGRGSWRCEGPVAMTR